MKERVVHVQKGQRVLVTAGRGVQVTVEREPSGAVTLRNETTGGIIRQWAPKEARTR